MRFTIFQDSRIGGRKSNQDRLTYSYSKDVLFLVIADGMGGHARGEIAAEVAVNTMTQRFQKEARVTLRKPFSRKPAPRCVDRMSFLNPRFTLRTAPSLHSPIRTTCSSVRAPPSSAVWSRTARLGGPTRETPGFIAFVMATSQQRPRIIRVCSS